jgi:hypothetical protein
VTIRKGKAASVVSGGRSKTDLLGGKIFQKHKAPRVNAQVILIVSPIFGRPGFFRAIIGNREIVAASRQPFLDGARALIRSGTDPATTIVMCHEGSDHDAMTGRASAAARLRVDESTLRMRPWMPPPPWQGVPSIALSDRALVTAQNGAMPGATP